MLEFKLRLDVAITNAQPLIGHFLSLSSVVITVHTLLPPTGVDVVKEEVGGEEEEEGREGREDIVGVYAERLSAMTHAFALCCHTLQDSTGR